MLFFFPTLELFSALPRPSTTNRLRRRRLEKLSRTGRRHIDRWHPSLIPRLSCCSKGTRRRDRVVRRGASWRRRRLSSCCRRWPTPRPSRARRGAVRFWTRVHPWPAPQERTAGRARTAPAAPPGRSRGRATAGTRAKFTEARRRSSSGRAKKVPGLPKTDYRTPSLPSSRTLTDVSSVRPTTTRGVTRSWLWGLRTCALRLPPIISLLSSRTNEGTQDSPHAPAIHHHQFT